MEEPFLREAVLNTIGPVAGAIVGGLIIGSLAAWITRRAQKRREDYEFRVGLVDDMIKVTNELYFELKNYEREVESPVTSEDRRKSLRGQLDKQYIKTRVAGEVLESRLAVHFRSCIPRQLWHAEVDLLKVRYLAFINELDRQKLEKYSGSEHTGVPKEELESRDAGFRHIHEKLRRVTSAVLQEPLNPVRG